MHNKYKNLLLIIEGYLPIYLLKKVSVSFIIILVGFGIITNIFNFFNKIPSAIKETAIIQENPLIASTIDEEDDNVNINADIDDELFFEDNERININEASKVELMTLPGIGDKKADLIVEYRNQQRFSSIDEIKNIKGIGEKTFEKFEHLLSV